MDRTPEYSATVCSSERQLGKKHHDLRSITTYAAPRPTQHMLIYPNCPHKRFAFDYAKST